jgi:2Fe-2S ferredoxin
MTIFVTDLSGKIHELDSLEGWRVMEIIRDHGLPIRAECGGACACATCHVYVDPDWQDRLPDPSAEEVDCLDMAFHVQKNSRLSCQIIMSEELEGLSLALAPETQE